MASRADVVLAQFDTETAAEERKMEKRIEVLSTRKGNYSSFLSSPLLLRPRRVIGQALAVLLSLKPQNCFSESL